MKLTKNRKRVYTACIITLFLYSLVMIKTLLPSSDIYWMISTGRFIAEHGIPTINPFTIHENFSIIIQQWLYDVIIYKLYSAAEFNAIFVFSALTYLMFFILLYKYIKILSNNIYTSLNLTLIFGFIIARLQHMFVNRPQFISLILILVAYIVIEKYKHTNNKKYLVILPMVSIIQANIHSSFLLVTFVMILPHLCKEFFNKKTVYWIKSKKALFISFICMILVSIINPYKLQGITYLIKSYREVVENIAIVELRKPIFLSVEGIIMIACICIIAIYVYIYKDNLRITYITMSIGTLILGLMHYRNIWLAVIGVIPLISTLLQNRQYEDFEQYKTVATCIVLGIISLILAVCMIKSTYKSEEDNSVRPELAVEYLNNYQGEIKLYNDFNSGGYLEMYGYKVYIDQRPEIYESAINNQKDIYSEYINLNYNSNTDELKSILDKYNFTHMIIRKGTTLDMIVQLQSDYKVVVDSTDYKLLEHVK